MLTKFNICEGSVGRDSNINNQKKFSSPPKRYDKIRLFDEIESSYCLGSEEKFCCLSILMLSARNIIGKPLGGRTFKVTCGKRRLELIYFFAF
jgi:hypothetical protein